MPYADPRPLRSSSIPARFDPFLVLLPLISFALHLWGLWSQGGYGVFRDELYYLACADHLSWGYVDHPPFSIFALDVWTSFFGRSLFSLRLLPALAGAATVLLTGLLARRLDEHGGSGANGETALPAARIAMLAAALAPIQLGLGGYYSMNAFDLLFWALAAYVFAGILLDDRPSTAAWLGLGVVLGLGLQNKISVLWLGGGLALGLLLSSRRRLLATRGPWLAALVALALFAPYVIWNAAHGFPTLEFMKNATSQKMVHVSPFEFAAGQLTATNLGAVPLWIAGAAWLLISWRARAVRPLGLSFLVVWLFLAFSGTARESYAAPAYSVALAAGGVAVASLTLVWRRFVIGALAVLIVAFAALAAPFVLPILPVETFIRYQAALGEEPSTSEKKEIGELPQHWADHHGWVEIVDAFEAASKSLTPSERERAVIFASNYGVAGAIDHFGLARGLPKAISGHNSYWLWGPRGATGEVVLVHSREEGRLHQLFESVELHGRIACGRCMPYENGMGVWICKKPRRPLAAIWGEVKHFD